MIPERQRPRAKRVVRSGFADQVPPVIEAYVATMLSHAEREGNEMTVDRVLRSIKETIVVEHLPSPRDFQKSLLSKRAHPAEVKVDAETDRVYLVGVGMPGREELVTEEMPVEDPRTGEVIGKQPVTNNVPAFDTVISYTEVSWRELRSTDERVRLLPAWVRSGLSKFFKMPEAHLVGFALATPDLTDEDLYRIAQSAYQA